MKNLKQKHMKNLKQKAIKIYGNADEKTKEALIDLFGKNTFKPEISDISCIEAICKSAKVKLSDILPYKKPKNADEENTNAFVIIKLICKVLNKGWVPDFTDDNQKKWYPYFEMSGSGFRFCATAYYCNPTLTHVSSQLC